MIRRADRPLTGPAQSRAYRADSTVNEPEVKLGRRPGAPDDVEIVASAYVDGEWQRVTRPSRHRRQPAVTVDLNAGRSGARTFEDPAELEAFARELVAAAGWLLAVQMQDKGAFEEMELPGMWEAADFTGGQDEVRP